MYAYNPTVLNLESILVPFDALTFDPETVLYITWHMVHKLTQYPISSSMFKELTPLIEINRVAGYFNVSTRLSHHIVA